MPNPRKMFDKVRGNVHVEYLGRLTQAPLPESIYLDGKAKSIAVRTSRRKQ
jgi:hypothetical protein